MEKMKKKKFWGAKKSQWKYSRKRKKGKRK